LARLLLVAESPDQIDKGRPGVVVNDVAETHDDAIKVPALAGLDEFAGHKQPIGASRICA